MREFLILCIHSWESGIDSNVVTCSVLEESMPHLRALLGQKPKATGHVVIQALQLPHLLVQRDNMDDEASIEEQDREYNPNPKLRWKVQFSNLVHAISKQAHPIVLVLEDLQWADEDSLGERHLIN